MALYESGQLVPDEIVVQLIEKKLERSREVKGFIFKGFPRTLVESYILDGLLRKVGSSISRSIAIQVPMLHGVVKVDGMGSFEEVFDRTSSVLESLFRAG